MDVGVGNWVDRRGAHVERLCDRKPRLVASQLGGGNHLHRLSDFRDILGRVDAHHDLLLRSHPSRRGAVCFLHFGRVTHTRRSK